MKVLQVLTRTYLAPAGLDKAVAFYEKLFYVKCDLRFKYVEAELELASVGPVLLIAGSTEKLQSFRHTQATFLVDSIEDFRNWLQKAGAVILEEPKKVPTGRNMRVCHPDGTIIEYVEHSR